MSFSMCLSVYVLTAGSVDCVVLYVLVARYVSAKLTRFPLELRDLLYRLATDRDHVMPGEVNLEYTRRRNYSYS